MAGRKQENLFCKHVDRNARLHVENLFEGKHSASGNPSFFNYFRSMGQLPPQKSILLFVQQHCVPFLLAFCFTSILLMLRCDQNCVNRIISVLVFICFSQLLRIKLALDYIFQIL